MARRLCVVDVFASLPLGGNPVAVVLDGEGLGDDAMQALARWMNLSETTFLLSPTSADADYRVRIFTPTRELPFAGHPTLGSAHAWLEAGGVQSHDDVVVQQCRSGLIRVRRTPDGLAFAGPPLVRSGPVDAELVARIAHALGIGIDEILDSQWVDNGPGWVAVLLRSADGVLGLPLPDLDLHLGVVGAYAEGGDAAFEVRAFFPVGAMTVEDPVTGSLNASLAAWLVESGRAKAPYVVRQGTAIGRRGRVHISADDAGTIWVAGATATCVTGTLEV